MNKDTNALTRARDLIYGDRAKDYGDPVENFDRLAALWSPVLGVEVTAQQVCLCLNQLKVSRLIHQPGHQDSIDDAAGYIGCYDRVTNERASADPWLEPAPDLATAKVYQCLHQAVDGGPFCGAQYTSQSKLDEHIEGHFPAPLVDPEALKRYVDEDTQLDDPLDRLAAEIEVDAETRLDTRPAPVGPAERTPIPPELANTTLHPVTQEALAKIGDPVPPPSKG